MTGDVKIANVRLDDVRVHAHNVRRDLGGLRTLVESIVRYGVMQPIVVEHRGDHFRIRAGHRRFAAARIAGLTRIPAVIHGEALDDDEWLVHAVQENVIRQGLSIEEKRDVIAAMQREGLRPQAIADAFGVSRGTIQNWLHPERKPETSEQMRNVRAKTVASFTRAWREYAATHDVSVEQILDALDVVAAEAAIGNALPPSQGVAA